MKTLSQKRKKELELKKHGAARDKFKAILFFPLSQVILFLLSKLFFLVKVILFLFLKHQMLTQRLKKKWYSPIGY